MTLDDFLANRPKAFNLSQPPAVSGMSVRRMIAHDIQAAIRHGVLPQGTKIRVRRGPEHPATKVGSMRLFVDTWPGPVFDDVFTAWVLDGERTLDTRDSPRSHLSARQYPSEQFEALSRIANRHNFRDTSGPYLRLGYHLTIEHDVIVQAAMKGLREERDAQLVGRCPRCKGKRIHQCLSGDYGCSHCDDDACGHSWVEKRPKKPTAFVGSGADAHYIYPPSDADEEHDEAAWEEARVS